ncbi:hypothetical protein QVD17_24992 [Tagetes erecta]|uniref:Uncharacterized protein n=1 Tax=Tagetes erecta TaxID=13708 RepID=A0AAD8KIN5_TARER|nr:hypothetical protein QVD17_24992 [Tagetes erecta]
MCGSLSLRQMIEHLVCRVRGVVSTPNLNNHSCPNAKPTKKEEDGGGLGQGRRERRWIRAVKVAKGEVEVERVRPEGKVEQAEDDGGGGGGGSELMVRELVVGSEEKAKRRLSNISRLLLLRNNRAE